jgi:global regulator protein family protein
VVKFHGDCVKIGIEAPADVVILRDELVAEGEGKCLAACAVAETVERNGNGGQLGTDHGQSDLRLEPIRTAAVKAPRKRLRRIPR